MMHDVYVQIVPNMPAKMNGMVMEMEDGTYTIFFQDTLIARQTMKTKGHEFDHIVFYDFEKSDVDEIERIAHTRTGSDRHSIYIINGDTT